MEERVPEQPHASHVCGAGGQQRHPVAAAFQCLLFDRNCRRDGRLVVGVRLDHRQGSAVAIGLVQISDELNDLRDHAADHDPERKIYFQRGCHRASPLFIFD